MRILLPWFPKVSFKATFKATCGLTLSLIAFCVGMPASARAQGAAEPWDVSQSARNLAAQAARLQPLLDQLTPQQWQAKGAPAVYVAQLRNTRDEVGYLVGAANNLGKQPEKLTVALETYFRFAIGGIAGDVAGGRRAALSESGRRRPDRQRPLRQLRQSRSIAASILPNWRRRASRTFRSPIRKRSVAAGNAAPPAGGPVRLPLLDPASSSNPAAGASPAAPAPKTNQGN